MPGCVANVTLGSDRNPGAKRRARIAVRCTDGPRRLRWVRSLRPRVRSALPVLRSAPNTRVERRAPRAPSRGPAALARRPSPRRHRRGRRLWQDHGQRHVGQRPPARRLCPRAALRPSQHPRSRPDRTAPAASPRRRAQDPCAGLRDAAPAARRRETKARRSVGRSLTEPHDKIDARVAAGHRSIDPRTRSRSEIASASVLQSPVHSNSGYFS